MRNCFCIGKRRGKSRKSFDSVVRNDRRRSGCQKGAVDKGAWALWFDGLKHETLSTFACSSKLPCSSCEVEQPARSACCCNARRRASARSKAPHVSSWQLHGGSRARGSCVKRAFDIYPALGAPFPTLPTNKESLHWHAAPSRLESACVHASAAARCFDLSRGPGPGFEQAPLAAFNSSHRGRGPLALRATQAARSNLGAYVVRWHSGSGPGRSAVSSPSRSSQPEVLLVALALAG
jgi:hypothetical protein